MKKISIKRIAFTAIFSALTVVLYIYCKIPCSLLPIFPFFLDINFSMIPVIIAAFMLGPIDAGVCVILRCLFKWLLAGTNTGYVGEVADIIIGLGACIPAGIIYNYTKLKYKTLFAFISVVAGWVIFAILSNAFINIPWFNYFYFGVTDGNYAELTGMCSDAFKLITFGNVTSISSNDFMLYYILLSVIPFNLLLSIIVVLVTLPIHKNLKNLYDMIGE